VSSDEKHLSIEQIENLIETQPDAREAHRQSVASEEARRHVATCDICRKLVSVHEECDKTLNSLRVGNSTDLTDDCPSESFLRELVSGILEPAEAGQLLRHAAGCDHCGPVLRDAAELLTGNILPEEETFIASLDSSKSSWQRSLATKLAGSDRVERREKNRQVTLWRVPSLRWAIGIAAISVCAIAITSIVYRSRPTYAESLLTQAYTERRTMELRVSGAKFSPLRITRSEKESNVERASSLLEAEALIAKNREKHPDNIDWLRAKGKADLLDGNYESAVDSLEQALRADPENSGVLTDLASAYFLRAQSTARATDYGAAIDLLGRAQRQSADDPVILFNRAIISERLFLYTQAINDWEHYLRIDPSGPWATEARQRLATLREKLKKREQGQAQPLLEPDQLAKANFNDPAFRATIEPRIEEYLRLAVREWMPQAYRIRADATLRPDTFASALAMVGRVARSESHDRWLMDILASSRSNKFPFAIETLSKAVRANEAGDYVAARAEAVRAERLFRSMGSPAGVLRSKVEEIYALHLSHEGALCLHALAGETNIDKYEYSWLRVQFRIEQAICQGLMGNLGEAQAVLTRAIVDADRSKYPTLYLRAIGNAAEMEAAAGNLNSAWDRVSAGLAFFWSRSLLPMQGYNLYIRLCSMAEEQQRPLLHVAIWSQALGMIDKDEDHLLRAMAHSTMASAALTAQMPDVANHEFSEADKLFEAAPRTRATTNDRIEAGTTLAGVEARAGRLTQSLALLESLRSGVAGLSNNYVAIQFYGVLGEVDRRLGNTTDAETALRSSVVLSELSLKSLKNERDRTTWSELTGDTYNNLVQLKLHAGDATGALELLEWYRGAPLRAGRTHESAHTSESYDSVVGRLQPAVLSEGPTLPTLHEVSDGLASLKESTVISYAVFSDELALWMFDDRGIESKVVRKPAREVDALVSKFVDLCSDPKSNLSDVESVSRTIYETLIAPIEKKLSPRRTVIVETEKSLDRLPMNVLMDSRGRYLSEIVPIVSSPGFYYRSLRKPGHVISLRSQALIVGVALPSDLAVGRFAAVVEAEREADEIAHTFGTARLLEGKEAKFDRVKKELRKTTVFHFAGHAVASVGGTGLVLADKVLTVDSLALSELTNLDLVVLSGCDTGRGSTGGSGDYDSFVRMFVRAGVRDVVASRWKVDSLATETIMKQFYRALLAGQEVPEALQEAQTSVRIYPETSHPYYWGAFTTFATI
jgi:CHAT domain-containing protein/tetratricopeptide (TPR) repeat protein